MLLADSNERLLSRSIFRVKIDLRKALNCELSRKRLAYRHRCLVRLYVTAQQQATCLDNLPDQWVVHERFSLVVEK